MTTKQFFLGIDIGGTNIKTVILNDEGTVLEKNVTSTEDNLTEKGLWKEKIIAQIDEKSRQYNNIKYGISAPGLVDHENKMILNMPERLQGIENFNWSAVLNKDIKVINDGHSACLAEYESFYRPKGIQHMLMLTLGTGVGGGIIINGKPYQGHLQRAGHVGHMTVDLNGVPTMTNMPGSIEHAIGNFSVSQRTKGVFNSTQELVEAVEKGGTKAKEWWLESVKRLAITLASLNNILAPELIVLGGGIATGAKESLMKPLQDFMGQYEWSPNGNKIKITIAKHGGFAGAIGAAYFARNTNKIEI